MKIKILEMTESQYYCNDDYNGSLYGVNSATDWEEVTDEEYEILKKWAASQNTLYNVKYVIVAEAKIDIPKTVSYYLEKVKLAEQEKEERVKKREERLAKRQKTIEERKEAKEKKLLLALKEKYGE